MARFVGTRLCSVESEKITVSCHFHTPLKIRFFAKKGMILEIRLFGLYLHLILTQAL